MCVVSEGINAVTHKVAFLDKPLLKAINFAPKDKNVLYHKHAIKAVAYRPSKLGHPGYSFSKITPIHTVKPASSLQDIEKELKEYETGLKEIQEAKDRIEPNENMEERKYTGKKGNTRIGKKTKEMDREVHIDELESFGMDSMLKTSVVSPKVKSKNDMEQEMLESKVQPKSPLKRTRLSADDELLKLQQELQGIKEKAKSETSKIAPACFASQKETKMVEKVTLTPTERVKEKVGKQNWSDILIAEKSKPSVVEKIMEKKEIEKLLSKQKKDKKASETMKAEMEKQSYISGAINAGLMASVATVQSAPFLSQLKVDQANVNAQEKTSSTVADTTSSEPMTIDGSKEAQKVREGVCDGSLSDVTNSKSETQTPSVEKNLEIKVVEDNLCVFGDSTEDSDDEHGLVIDVPEIDEEKKKDKAKKNSKPTVCKENNSSLKTISEDDKTVTEVRKVKKDNCDQSVSSGAENEENIANCEKGDFGVSLDVSTDSNEGSSFVIDIPESDTEVKTVDGDNSAGLKQTAVGTKIPKHESLIGMNNVDDKEGNKEIVQDQTINRRGKRKSSTSVGDTCPKRRSLRSATSDKIQEEEKGDEYVKDTTANTDTVADDSETENITSEPRARSRLRKRPSEKRHGGIVINCAFVRSNILYQLPSSKSSSQIISI